MKKFQAEITQEKATLMRDYYHDKWPIPIVGKKYEIEEFNGAKIILCENNDFIHNDPLLARTFFKDNFIITEIKEDSTDQNNSMVDHPDHYQSDKMEVIDVIDAFDLGFNLGNVVKYVLRCGKKDNPVQELEKAKKYLEFEIKKLKGNK